MIMYDLFDVFLLGLTVTLPTAALVILWSYYKGDFD
jgi:hypothetical protein